MFRQNVLLTMMSSVQATHIKFFWIIVRVSITGSYLKEHRRTFQCFCSLQGSTAFKEKICILKASVASPICIIIINEWVFFVHCHSWYTIYVVQCYKRKQLLSVTDYRLRRQIADTASDPQFVEWNWSQIINISQLEARLLATVSVLYCSYMVLYK